MEAAAVLEMPAVEARERLAGFVDEVVAGRPHVRQRENALVYVRGLVEQGGGRVCSRRCFGWVSRLRAMSRCSSFWPTRRGIRVCSRGPVRSGSRRRSVWSLGLLTTRGSRRTVSTRRGAAAVVGDAGQDRQLPDHGLGARGRGAGHAAAWLGALSAPGLV